MLYILKDFLIVSLTVAIGIGFLVFGVLGHHQLSQLSYVIEIEQEAPLLPDGALIKALDNEPVYYIENGKKRWIESKETFRIQGFLSENINTLPVSEVNRYEEGEPITPQSNIVLPEEANTLPDLVPLAIKDLQLKKLNGRTILKFTASFWNQGKSHFELYKGLKTEIIKEETYQEVYQPILQKNGTYRNKVVGNFTWHTPHTHYHYSDFANYVLSFIKPTSDTQISNNLKAVRQKTTFCIRDNEPLSLTLLGAPKKALFPTCGQNKQGISIGWVDVYKNTLPDQYIDVHDMPAGIYGLSFFLDPNQRFVEESKNNNISTTFIELDAKRNTAKILISVAPFITNLNNFPDTTLIRAGGEERVYVTHGNKKRAINDLKVFNSYNYSWDDVFILTQSMIDVIPFNNLVRLEGTEEVYALNKFGYKRHILNPGVFYSYEFKANDIADINQTEFESYPRSDLIRLIGNGEIYLITDATKKEIGSINIVQSLGYNLNTIHTVNESDYNAYATLP